MRDTRCNTLGMRRLLREASRAPAAHVPDHPRPRTRADCANVPRPCPYVGCKWNLFLDVRADGAIKFQQTLDIEDRPLDAPSCVLDVALTGGKENVEIAKLLGVSRERIRQEAEFAMEKLRASRAPQDTEDHEDMLWVDYA